MNRSPLSITVLTDDPANLSDQLRALPTVDDVIGLPDFIPSDQDEKLALVEDLALVMALDEDTQWTAISDQERRLAIETFLGQLSSYLDQHPQDTAGQTLFTSLQAWQARAAADYEALESDLLSTLPGRIDRLNDSLAAEFVDDSSLPTSLTDRWLADQAGHAIYRLQVFPKADLDNNAALEAFVADVRRIAPQATDTPIINVEASRAVIEAFQVAFSLALIVISILLFFLLDRRVDVIIALLPLLLAGLVTAAATVLVSIPFNFANIIALPLLLGIGVDSAIHMIHRYRSALPEDGNLLGTSTARAVLISALTTMCSFGNLAVSPHTGTASMGVLLTIGLCLTLLTTLFVLPSLLKVIDHSTHNKEQSA